MLGAHLRKASDRLLAHCGFLSQTKISPNFVTAVSLVPALGFAWCIYYKSYALATLLLMSSFALDLIDGFLARKTGKETLFGGYLDAIIDRCREIIIYIGFALAGYAFEALLVLAGALLVSFAKARTALCVPIDNHDWPAIGDMTDRNIVIIVGLIVASFKPVWGSGYDTLSLTLILNASVVYMGVIGRVFYARSIIMQSEMRKEKKRL